MKNNNTIKFSSISFIQKPIIILLLALLASSNISFADQVFLDDVIVTGSECVGQDCVNGENFGFDALRLKENNLRIHFDDTSSTGSFPGNDWRIVINDSSNGGANYFAIEDSTAGRVPFKVEAGARANALVVESDGDVGLGTANPVVNLHVVDGNTPTTRLEQDGSSGFTPQTWDLAGNESNFFIRDVTNGSKLPFRIQPGAPDASIYINAKGYIGNGAGPTPDAKLHLVNASGENWVTTRLENGGVSWDATHAGNGAYRLNNSDHTGTELELTMEGNLGLGTTPASGVMMHIKNNGYITTRLENASAGVSWDATNTGGGAYRLNASNHAGIELELDTSGNLSISGNLTVASAGSTIPDYVFKDDYNLKSLDEVKSFIDAQGHLPGVPSAAEIEKKGHINMTQMQLTLLEKVEELTLYILKQDKTIKLLSQQVSSIKSHKTGMSQ